MKLPILLIVSVVVAITASAADTLRVTIDRGLPGGGDLQVDVRQELGYGIAFIPPAREHVARIEMYEVAGNDMKLALALPFGRYQLDLQRHGDGWRGSYTGDLKGTKVQSLTHVADDTAPVLARAEWVRGPEPKWPATPPVIPTNSPASLGVWDCRYVMQVDEFLTARAVRRFLLTGLGENGAANGQPEFAAALPVIKGFVEAYRQKHGVNLGAGTGLEARTNGLTVVEDRRMGTYVMRGGGDWVATFTTGGVIPARRGHFTLAGLGREWVRESSNDFNTVHVHPAQVTRLKTALPATVGLVQRVCVYRDGTGSVAMLAHGFVDEATNAVESIGYPYEPRSWRTIGVDYSGASGAAALLVSVEGHAGLGDRRQAWEADIGDVPAEQVVIEGATFTVKPTGTKATMRGTVVYPVTAHIDYLPPADGRGGRIRLWRTKPEKASDVQLEASLDRKVEEVSLAFKRQIEANPDNELKLALDLDLEEQTPKPEVAKAMERQHLSYFGKMFKHTTSTSMGGPNRAPQARASWVVVLTVQEDAPPKVEPVSFEDPALVKVGGQVVEHQEYLIEFGRKR